MKDCDLRVSYHYDAVNEQSFKHFAHEFPFTSKNILGEICTGAVLLDYSTIQRCSNSTNTEKLRKLCIVKSVYSMSTSDGCCDCPEKTSSRLHSRSEVVLRRLDYPSSIAGMVCDFPFYA